MAGMDKRDSEAVQLPSTQESALKDLVFPGQCSLCIKVYDEGEHIPRIFRCGHTYCTTCIDGMVINGYVKCPECHVHHKGTSAAQFPVNHSIVALMKKYRELKLFPVTKKIKTLEEATSSVPQKAETSNQEEASGVSKMGKKALKKRKADLKREMRERKLEEAQLRQYREQLNECQAQHMQNLERLYELMEENKSVLFLLEQVNSKLNAQREEGQLGDQKMHAALRRMENATTAHEAIEAISQAHLVREEAHNWQEEFKELFPDINALSTHMKVLSERFEVPLPKKYQ